MDGNETRSFTSGSVALAIEGLRQIIRIPGTKETFTLHVAQRIDVPSGAFVGILGQTGCGKTTLLTVLGLLRGATAGSSLKTFEMSFRGVEHPKDLTEIWRKNRSAAANALRRQHLGFALQNGELLPTLSVAENIAFPLRVNGWGRRRIQDRVDFLIDAFRLFRSFQDEIVVDKSATKTKGVSSLANVRVNHLSGGQYQRVALARAVAHQPEFLFVDEPTASLNRGVARTALQQLANLRSDNGTRSTIFMVTHDEEFAREFCNQIIRMRPLTDAGEDAAGEVVFDFQCA